MLRSRWIVLAAVAAAFGCGGGGGASSGSGDPGGITATAGFLSVRASGNGPGVPVVMGSKNAVVTGFAGAAYSTATVTLPTYQNLPSADQTRAKRFYYNGGGAVWLYDFATGRNQNINGVPADWSQSNQFSLAKSGSRIAYTKAIGNVRYLFSADSDGANQIQWAGISEPNDFMLSPDGKQMYVTLAGSKLIRLYSSSNGSFNSMPQTLFGELNEILDMSQDGASLLIKSTRQSDGLTAIQVVATTGSGIYDLLAASSQVVYDGVFSADKSRVILTTFFGAEPCITSYLNQSPSGGFVLYRHPSSEGSIEGIGLMPDNRNLLTTRRAGGNRLIEQLDTLKPETLGFITSMDNFFQVRDLTAAPYINYRTLVGGSTGLYSACSAMLYSQVGSTFGSFLAIDATNRSASTVISQDDPSENQSVIVATLVAGASNKFTGIRYINDLSDNQRTGGNLVSFDGAVVTIDALSGDIVAVLPYNGTKAAHRTIREGDSVRLQGEFLAVLDAKGNNIASGGANEVQINGLDVRVVR